jgi:hypothetical protein
MSENELYVGYAGWLCIIIGVSFLFDFLEKKGILGFKLFLFSILPIWFLYTIGMILVKMLYFNSDYFFETFTSALIEALPQILAIGGLTFGYKYYKLLKRQSLGN